MPVDIPEDARPGFVASEMKTSIKLSDTKEFWIRGNHRDRIGKIFLEQHSSERCIWFDVVYVESFDITRLNVALSSTLHKVDIADLVYGHEYVEIDFDEIKADHRLTSDDLVILEQEEGLL